MGKKVLEQRKALTISCQYFNAYRIFLLFCCAASVVVMFLGFTGILDFVRSVAMTVMIILFLSLREGMGPEGFVYSGTIIPYTAVSHYDTKSDEKYCMVYVIFREKVKDKVEESSIVLRFKKENEKEVLQHLQTTLPKKQKRIKKA